MRIASIAALLLAACGSSSSSYLEDTPGYVTAGEVVAIANLNSDKITRLSDGVAVEITQPGCRVQLRFQDGTKKELALEVGYRLVYGKKSTYVLRPHGG